VWFKQRKVLWLDGCQETVRAVIGFQNLGHSDTVAPSGQRRRVQIA
jgi:hypothetical protein